MSDQDPSRKSPKRSDDLFFTGPAKRPVSPENDRVWRSVLLLAAGCVLAWMFVRLIPVETGLLKLLVITAVLAASWGLAVGMLFIRTRARLFWVIWLVIGIVPLASSRLAVQGWIGASVFSFVFLLLRRFRPYEALAPRRQAYVFGLGLILLPMLLFFWPPGHSAPVPSAPRGDAGMVPTSPLLVRTDGEALSFNVLRFSLFSLRWFWFFSLFHLLVTVRLHFMKLRPKLAIAAVFLILVPIVLLIALGTGLTYVTLGQSHAAGARSLLEEWQRLAARDRDFVQTLSPDWFSAETGGGGLRAAGRPPEWLADLADGLSKPGSPFGPDDAAKGALFWEEAGLWLVGFSRSGSGVVAIRGCPVDETSLSRLAGLVHSDVILRLGDPVSFTKLDSVLRDEETAREAIKKLRGEGWRLSASYRPAPAAASARPREAEAGSFFGRTVYFGTTELDVFLRDKEAWIKGRLGLELQRSLRTTLSELFSVSSPVGTIVLAVLIGFGFVFLVLELLALSFGLRISGGITKGIRTLHRQVSSMAEGDLDSRIEIPNQDELGDLAASFNLMTAAVRQGREEAIARERLEKELETARAIQERLLPHRMPDLPGFEVSGISLPSHEVGGDYFDFLDLPTGQLGVAVADVSGKGIPAALLMANLQASLRAQDLKPDRLSAVASRLNGLFVQRTDERMFVTFFCGILDRMTAAFSYTNAGHNPPMLLRANGKLLRLEEGGMLLGFLADQPYVQATVALEPGDVLVLFTDGITEAVNPEADSRETKYFGEERLVEVLRAAAGRSAADIQAAVLAAVSAHTRQAPPGDDMTLVVIKRTGGQEASAYVS